MLGEVTHHKKRSPPYYTLRDPRQALSVSASFFRIKYPIVATFKAAYNFGNRDISEPTVILKNLSQ